MKTASILAGAILLTVLMAIPAAATPPSKVTLNWNAGTQTLEVLVDHLTLDPQLHYIKLIQVTVDGKDAGAQTFTSQTNSKQQIGGIKLSGVKPGAVIVATAFCSLFGSGSGQLTVP